ncbi:MAG TPA: MFS transporter [Actinocrinis sp.]|nr:MFS transporter [Actinocrinis sp.]
MIEDALTGDAATQSSAVPAPAGTPAPSPPARRTERARLLLFGGNTLVSTLGTGLFLAASPVYFHTVIGLSSTRIGFGFGLGALCGFLVGAWIGPAADRLGAARAMCLLNIWRVFGYLGFVLVHSYGAFLAVAVLLLALDRPSIAVNQSAVAEVFGAERRSDVMAGVRTLRNAGFLAGVGFGAVLLGVGGPTAVRWAVAANAASYLPGVAFFWWISRNARADRAGSGRGVGLRQILGAPGGRAAGVFSACNTVLMCHEAVLLTALPLWVLDHTAAPRWTQSVVLGIDSLLAIAFQIPISRRVRGWRSARRCLGPAAAAFAAAAVCFDLAVTAHSPAGALTFLAIGAAFLSAVEVLHLIALTEISYVLAPPEHLGSYLGFYYLGVNAERAIGPAAVTWLVAALPVPGWLLLAAVYAGAAVVAMRAARLTALSLPGVPA